MKIYSMTATFGKLENQTLTLQPGLNIIHAPNEWGKSTWCAFLVNMLYGMETRTKSTKSALADKERYAPWSGAPMSGRMELNWNGRDITIERWTKGRIPLGEFRAYETGSGVAVPELTAATCGEMLLGVERSVFLRSAFLRLSDLPVTEDEALRRRLNSLVTTGDESNTADALAQKLKELKNKCRYNRSGLIPQAEAEREELRQKLEKMEQYRAAAERLERQQEEARQYRAELENHNQALLYAEAAENNRRIAQAQLQAKAAKAELEAREQVCAGLPEAQQAEHMTQTLRRLNEQSMALHLQRQMLPPPPQKPEVSPAFEGLPAAAAVEKAASDRRRYEHLEGEKKRRARTMGGVTLGCALAMLLLLGGMAFGLPGWAALAGALTMVAVLVTAFVLNIRKTEQIRREIDGLFAQYPGIPAGNWLTLAETEGRRIASYEKEAAEYGEKTRHFTQKQQELVDEIQKVTEGKSVDACLQKWAGIAESWRLLEQARQQWENASRQAQTLAELARPVQMPEKPDTLTLSREQTRLTLAEVEKRQELLHHQYGQNQGLMEALGQENDLRACLQRVDARLERLNETYGALELAQSTLADAASELQRRFAPRISSEAQRIFAALTNGRYDRLTLSQDLSLNAGAEEESVLHTARWRSEGTVDQMYLALRLAVAEELSPHAPLILDDVLVRFDDKRHAAAMEILKSQGEKRQILLFTCQNRELAYQ